MDAGMTIAEEKEKRALEAFSEANDSRLENLEKDLKEFNIFTCLKLTEYEIRHSSFLAWLLDPKENHGLKDDFLKSFLKLVIKEIKNENNSNDIRQSAAPEILDIEGWEMSEVSVATEHKTDDNKRIDLLLKDDENKFVLIIENKLRSSQHGNQLESYKEYIDKEFPKYKKLFIYLKPKKNETIPASWVYLTYDKVKTEIERLLNTPDKLNDEAVKIAITHYKEILTHENNYYELCREIYKDYGEAIDLINKNNTNKNNDAQICKACNNLYKKYKKAIDLIIKEHAGKKKKEERILNFINQPLEYLLQPCADHGLKNKFLKRFLNLLGLDNNEYIDSIKDIKIKEPIQQFDLIFEFKYGKEDCVVAIKNKLFDQLSRKERKNRIKSEYNELQNKKEFKGKKIFVCWLIPTDKGWKNKGNENNCYSIECFYIIEELDNVLESENLVDDTKQTIKDLINEMDTFIVRMPIMIIDGHEYRFLKKCDAVYKKQNGAWIHVEAKEAYKRGLHELSPNDYPSDIKKVVLKINEGKLYTSHYRKEFVEIYNKRNIK